MTNNVEPSTPEYVKCIKHTHLEKKNLSWCGKQLYKFDWVFQDIDHATYAIMDGSRLVPCPDCLNVITSVLIIS